MQLEKWEHTATSTNLQGIKADQAWSLISDYYNIHNHVPSLVSTCQKIDGGRRLTVPANPGSPSVYWLKDRLVRMDHAGRSYTYEIFDNNVGFGRAVSTLKVVAVDRNSCKIEWTTKTEEPVKEWKRSQFEDYVQSGATEIAKTVAETLGPNAK